MNTLHLATMKDAPSSNATAQNTPGVITWVRDTTALERLTLAIAQSSEIVFDLETTGLNEHAVTGGRTNGGVAARIVLASFTIPQQDHSERGNWDGAEPTTWLLPLSHPDSPFQGTWRATMREVALAMSASARPVIGHNVKFDIRWITATTGVDLSGSLRWDTQVSSHLLDENDSTKLKERAPKTFNVPRWDDFDLGYPGAAEDVPLEALGEYAARDTYWTWRLYLAHRSSMFLDDDEPPYTREEIGLARVGRLATRVAMPTSAALTRMEQRGIALDVDWTRETLRENETVAATLLEELATRYPLDGEPSLAPTSKWFGAFTEAAVAAGELEIMSMTRRGNAQWSKSVLKKNARNGSTLAQTLLDQRAASKRAEFLRSWLEEVTPDGRIHASYRVGHVSTGRLSSSNPNMQQVTYALRPAFIPSPGYVLVDLDYSQIELRVASYIARCEPMLEAFREGADLHARLAAQIAGIRESEVTKEQRQAAKAANFGLLYGMSAEGFHAYAEDAYGVHISLDEAEHMREQFFSLWDGLRDWHALAVRTATNAGEIASPLGRIRRVPDIWDRSTYLQQQAERKAINSPVQGMASDLLQIGAASIAGVLPGHEALSGVHLVATVHDSIVCEVREDDWERLVTAAQQRLTNLSAYLSTMDVALDVPLVADYSVGTRWGLSDISES